MSFTMAASHPSPVKDGRRILGEKPANACLSPAHPRHASVSPLKRPLLETPSSPKKLLRSPLFAGQKRSIDQVDASEPPSSTQPSTQAPSRPDPSQNVQDDNFPQQDSQPIQRQSHATESETPLLDSDKQHHHHHHHHEPQATQQPQQEDTHLVSPPATAITTTTHPIPNDPAIRKRFIKEKATLLRIRLQTAMRHIHDPQLDRRLSDLEAHSRKYPRLSLPQEQRSTTTIQSTPTQSSSSTSNPCLTTPRVHTAPQLTPSTALHASGLSSPPLSAGTITTPAVPPAEDLDLEEDEKEEGDEENDPMKTPTQKTHRRMNTHTQTSPMQLSSPPATVSRRRMTTEEFLCADNEQEDVMREAGEAGEEMEESHPEERQRRCSQKGDAVDGLLKLMNTGDQSEGLEVWSG
ncbi:hypothetical protein ASPCADRAFT_126681 [Aspergillus carbonarius ITEM 5010]|uniref:Uncharacterized protein n=1 Tax=Aspergillus carbonarius (strain ITEM 5010) TaxID=602072 RepID=A0A1R3RZ76_ASPC5|nr:hypothetical protein ASPCADRAFT_126681 [Aspergillus carbonarius ITEM 5010]